MRPHFHPSHCGGWWLALLLLLAVPLTRGQIPHLLNYQGRVQVGTNDFQGTGQFKFALVNADGTTTYWSNDGTAAGQPAAAVTLPVTKGLYSVLLGHTALPNMTALPPAALASGDAHLRVWFNDGLHGFQQFVPDQRIAAAAYALTADRLAGPISVDQLPSGVPRETNGTTTIAGNVVVEGTVTAAGLNATGALSSSGLPAGTVFEVLLNNAVAPGVRFEGLETLGGVRLRLSRVMVDLSWPGPFQGRSGVEYTNAHVSLRLSLPGGARIEWKLAGQRDPETELSYKVLEFFRKIGSDGKPYDYIELSASRAALSRTNINVFGQGSRPFLPVAAPPSGHPSAASLRLNVDGVNFNNVLFLDAIHPGFRPAIPIVLNPTFHTTLSAWSLGELPTLRSAQITLINGLPGSVSVLAQAEGIPVHSYELRLASDGLPVEVISIGNR